MDKAPKTFFSLDRFVPSLRETMKDPAPDLDKILLAAVPVKEGTEKAPVPRSGGRNLIVVTDGRGFWPWEVGSLEALFRGDKQPPELGAYPEAYNEQFMLLDLHALEISKFFGDRRDLEMLEIYSALRRRPYGRSLSFVHDYMWQAAAMVLGTTPLSQAEYEAILARLERSCRTFAQGPTSRNYVSALRSTLGRR